MQKKHKEGGDVTISQEVSNSTATRVAKVQENQGVMKRVAMSFTRTYPAIRKICQRCHNAFVGTTKSIFCSVSCRSASSYAKNAKKRSETARKKYKEKKLRDNSK